MEIICFLYSVEAEKGTVVDGQLMRMGSQPDWECGLSRDRLDGWRNTETGGKRYQSPNTK